MKRVGKFYYIEAITSCTCYINFPKNGRSAFSNIIVKKCHSIDFIKIEMRNIIDLFTVFLCTILFEFDNEILVNFTQPVLPQKIISDSSQLI